MSRFLDHNNFPATGAASSGVPTSSNTSKVTVSTPTCSSYRVAP